MGLKNILEYAENKYGTGYTTLKDSSYRYIR